MKQEPQLTIRRPREVHQDRDEDSEKVVGFFRHCVNKRNCFNRKKSVCALDENCKDKEDDPSANEAKTLRSKFDHAVEGKATLMPTQ